MAFQILIKFQNNPTFKVWSISVSIPPFFGWSTYGFSGASYTCASELNSDYFKFYVSATFPIPILIIFPTYYFILKSSMGGTGTMTKSKRHRGNLRTAKIILLIIIIFAVSATTSEHFLFFFGYLIQSQEAPGSKQTFTLSA